ncbi:MAG: L-fucose isomerase [Lawsonibacter sp.]|nr:L-fucose isomerase [Lawsonibacter sp.]
MSKIKVGLLSFSDGRASVHASLGDYIVQQGADIKSALEATGEIEVLLPASGTICSNGLARQCAREIKAQLPDVVVFNVPIFAFPNFSVVAESVLELPTLVLSNVNGGLPGLGGLQAASNFLRQCGYPCEKVWGNISEPDALAKCMHFLRAAYAASQLRGQVFGLIGGRSIGMGSGSAPADLWQHTFGVDVDHTDQLEIVHRAAQIPEEQVQHAYDWLCSHTRRVEYDNDKLTESSLKEQIRHYYATKSICEEKSYAFVGVKCHYELSAYSCTQCLAAAFFNDPYDWDGPKDIRVFTCEGDCEGGLTMQVMRLLSGEPAIFADFRFYKAESNLLYFCNCGAMATWYANRSADPIENMKKVSLRPIIAKYTGKGCHVEYIAKGGKMTFGRITHELDHFIFTVFTGTAKELPEEALNETCTAWPHVFVEPDAPYEQILAGYDCNHVHAIAGDWVEEICHFCQLKGIELRYIH